MIPEKMKALTFHEELKMTELPLPVRQKGEALIRVVMAGICNTDHEILKGYVPGFNGIPGHEFVGIVEEAETAELVGKRVAGEINVGCGSCEFCRKGLGRHCPNRTVVGIINHPGAFAEYICLPEENLITIPISVDNETAVFIEPLAAAFEILEQVNIGPDDSVLLLGDGKLGLLCSLALAHTGCDLTVCGKHSEKLAFCRRQKIKTVLLEDFKPGRYDIVVEAAGNSSAFDMALDNVKPRGTIVLKSTYASTLNINAALVVVNEINLVGSRCGRFAPALDFMVNVKPPLKELISAKFPFEDALKGFELSARKESLKVILEM